MKISVKCFATLADADHCDFNDSTDCEVADGADVSAVIRKLDLPEDKVELVFVNHKKATTDTKLADGDQVGFFPAVGGM